MSTPEWTSDMSVGHERLDRQHRRLLELCREAERLEDCGTPEQTEKFHAVISELCRYVEEHFSDEERMLRHVNFPDLPAHEKEHLSFISHLSEIIFNASRGVLEAEKLHHFLCSWLVGHIMTSDIKYKDFFRQPEADRNS